MREGTESYRILIVEPDEVTKDLMSMTVLGMGHTAVLSQNVSLAKKECQKRIPDLIILDLTETGAMGYELCEWVKNLHEDKLIPILGLVKRSSDKDRLQEIRDKVHALESGADDFLTKPFVFQELKARLRALLRVKSFNEKLIEKNRLLQEAQDTIIAQERQLVATQLAGSAAHNLGQPITAMKLNCHLLQTLQPGSEKFDKALLSVKNDLKILSELIEKLKNVDASKTEYYPSGIEILEID